MGGKSSRTKGHSFERKIAILLREIFPKAQRNLEYQSNNCFGVDIAGTGKYYIQCKKLKQYVSINTIDEIKCHPELGDVPILITAGDNKPAMAVIAFHDLLNLLRIAENKA